MDYLAGYLDYIPGLLNYPLYFSIRNVFKGGSFSGDLVPTISALQSKFGNHL